MPTTTCQSCGEAIKFPSAKIGPPITCPACKAETPTVWPLSSPAAPATSPQSSQAVEHELFVRLDNIDQRLTDVDRRLANIDGNTATIKSILVFWITLGLLGAAVVVFRILAA